MRVRDLMVRDVVSAPIGTPVQTAFHLMRDGGFRHLPVLDNGGKLVGIVSDRDLREVGAIYTDDDTGLDELLVTEESTVESVMSSNPITIAPDAPVRQAVKLIKEWRVGCLVVTDADEMVGILSYMDILDAAVIAFEGSSANP